jgi:hypothetical protein
MAEGLVEPAVDPDTALWVGVGTDALAAEHVGFLTLPNVERRGTKEAPALEVAKDGRYPRPEGTRWVWSVKAPEEGLGDVALYEVQASIVKPAQSFSEHRGEPLEGCLIVVEL